MTVPQDVQQFIGHTTLDSEGSKIGKISQVYLDEQSGMPMWVTVATGLFGTRQSFAPLYGAQVSGGEVTLAVTKEQIKDAPNVDDDGRIDASEQDALYRHYAGYLGEQQTGYGPSGQAVAQGRDTSGPVTDDAMTRSEEQLRVGTETVEAGRARLRKYVVTENVSTTVPVSHEEVRVEREPITDDNRDAALSGKPISEEEHEVTLRAERPVVAKEAVPVERVRLTTETVTEDAAVSETVRKEQIEEPGVEGSPRDAGR
jgi:uncharacterized protein (TIGR02271 family)